MLLVGGAILIVFSLANGFVDSYAAFIVMRALTGIGGGLIMPSGVALIKNIVPPGKTRNITMGFFAASAPIGGWVGALLAGIFTEYTEWKWMFFFLALFSAVTFIPLYFLSPRSTLWVRKGMLARSSGWVVSSSLVSHGSKYLYS
jgi:MFS family permease